MGERSGHIGALEFIVESADYAAHGSPEDDAWPERPRLGRLLETLGPHVLYAACSPEGADRPIGDLVIHDPGDALPERPDAILLAVGAPVTGPATAELVRHAASQRFAAVIVKDRGTDSRPLIDAALDARIALLITPETMPWRHLDALMTAALTASAEGPPAYVSVYSSLGLGDLFALANAVAANVGGATTIEDPQGNVLAFSNLPQQEIDEIRKQAILGRRTPDRPGNRGEYGMISKTAGPVHFQGVDPAVDRLAVAVRAGAQLLGYIFVLDGVPPLGPRAPQALMDAGRIAALHLLRSRSSMDPQRWHRAEALRALLDGDTSGSSAAARLGMPPDTPAMVLAFAPAGATSEPGLTGARIVDLVSLCCEAWHNEAVCTTSGGGVYALVPVVADAPRLTRFAEDVVATVRKAIRIELHVGIGSRADSLDDVPDARRTADKVVRVLAETAGDQAGVTSEERVRSRIALLDLAERGAAAADLLVTPVRRMIEHDASHGTSHVATLLEFLDAFGETAKAAAALSVHENTLRYRIRRLQELFDVNLADPTDRLVIWLQLRLWQRTTTRQRNARVRR